MGMTIEQKIKTLIELYHYIKGDTHFCGYIEENATNALETAIETMKKYQKIAEIVMFGNVNELGFEYVGEKITEVIEDGQNTIKD